MSDLADFCRSIRRIADQTGLPLSDVWDAYTHGPDPFIESREPAHRLAIAPITMSQANDFIAQHHSHSGPVSFQKFSLGCFDTPEPDRIPVPARDHLAGVVVAHRPASRHLDDRHYTLEISRLCTDGTRMAASKLIAHAARAAFAMGYVRLVTYTLLTEPATCLKAAGWRLDGFTAAKSWDSGSRARPNSGRAFARKRYLLFDPKRH